MTHPNFQTNGASLEDCHTNFFALTELSGIKWRKLTWSEPGGGSHGPGGHHHHQQQHQQHHHQHHHGGHGHHQHQHQHQQQQHTTTIPGEPLNDPVLRSYSRCLAADILCVWRRVSSGITRSTIDAFDPAPPPAHPPPLSLASAKELWIFWYGEEPDLNELVAPELNMSECEHGSWESGLSYECRSLLFKALHNLIERCLLSRDFIRLGKWFVQPYDYPAPRYEAADLENSSNSSSSTTTTTTTGFNNSSSASSASAFSAAPPPTANHLSFSFAFFVHGESSVCASIDVRQHPPIRRLTRMHMQEAQTQSGGIKVILAPFGLAGTLTGQSFRSPESTAKFLDDWSHFYPLDKSSSLTDSSVVEVIVGGAKMRYPSCYVMVTDMDDTGNSHALIPNSSSAVNSSLNERLIKSIDAFGRIPLINVPTPPVSPIQINSRVPQLGPHTISIENMNNMSRQQNAAQILSERTWQQCMCGGDNKLLNKDDGNWDYVEPIRKANCTCIKPRKYISSLTKWSQSSSGTNLTLNPSLGLMTTSSRAQKSKNRIPFHRRSSIPSIKLDLGGRPSVQHTEFKPCESAVVVASQSQNTQDNNNMMIRTCMSSGSYTPQGGPPSYPRTQESMIANSVGSPASVAPSPLQGPHSQPASVPPGDSTMPTLSPNPPIDQSSPSMMMMGGLRDKSHTPPDSVHRLLHPKSDVDSPAMISPCCGNNNNGKNDGDGKSEERRDDTDNKTNSGVITVLKRPCLQTKVEHDVVLGEEEHTLDMLYDYTTQEGWLNHPVKRFKPDGKETKFNRKTDLYTMFHHNGISQLNNNNNNNNEINIKQEIKQEPEDSILRSRGVKRPGDPYEFDEDAGANNNSSNSSNNLCKMDGFARIQIKEEPKDRSNDILLTNEGLQPSYKDLDQIFDNSDYTSSDEACFSQMQIQTPPGSAGPSTNHILHLDDPSSSSSALMTITSSSSSSANNPTNNKRLSSSSSSGGGGGGGQGQTNLGGCPNIVGGIMPPELSKMFPTPPSLEHNPIASPCSGGQLDLIGQQDYPDLSIIRIKQEIYPMMGSPQEENIDDWSFVFKPPSICKIVGSSKYAPLTNLPSQMQPVQFPTNCVYKPSWIQHMENNKQQQQQQNNSTSSNNTNNNASSNNNHHNNSTNTNNTPNNNNNNNSITNNLNCNIINRNRTPTPLSSTSSIIPNNNIGHNNNNNNSIFPPSPLHPPGFRPPPPPYELPSPANSTTSSSYLNKNLNSVEPIILPTTPQQQQHPNHQQHQQQQHHHQRAPEANSLVLNILLTDTSFNIFRDHNFDSCTLCVCNAGSKVVGNIRGADAGIYLLNSYSDKLHAIAQPTSPYQSGLGQPPPPYGSSLLSPQFQQQQQQQQQHQHQQQQQQQHHVEEEELNRKCTCGFSAVVNRRLAYGSGLFYEDEMEITGIAEDPGERKKSSLASLLNLKTNNDPSSTIDREQLDSLPNNVMDLIRDQLVFIPSTANSLNRAAQYVKQRKFGLHMNPVHVLEFTDSNEITTIAIEQSKNLLENLAMCKMESTDRLSKISGSIGVHRWPYLRARGPQCNQDIVTVMKSLQPLLQDAIQKKCQTRLWEAPSAVKGPLTWRQFHRLAGRGTDDRCEPQPIPSVIVGHDKDWLCLSPYALQQWESLMLEPYSYSRDVAYVVVAPDNDAILPRVKTFFKELSTAYEICKLGRHSPITKVLRDGILRVGRSAKQKIGNEPVEEWFNLLGDSETGDMLKLYAQVCKHHLAPHLQQVQMDKTLLDPPIDSNNAAGAAAAADRPAPSPMPPPSTPDSGTGGGGGGGGGSSSQCSNSTPDKAPSTPKSDQDGDGLNNNKDCSSFASNCLDSPHNDDDEAEIPSIVVYLVEPFTMNSDKPDLQRLAVLALLRCFQSVLASVPENIRNNISVQIISLESIVELNKSREMLRHSDHMRSLALNIFSQCRRLLIQTNSVKSLTGFGTAANADLFLKSKDEKNRGPYRLFTPPYVLAPIREKVEAAEQFGKASQDQSSSVLYISYCLSEDQSWLLAVCTDERGEIFETITINIDIPNRSRRKKASARRIGLEKLMTFILSVMSQSVRPWRLVVGRLGRIGHGELKGWSWLLSKKNLVKASKHLNEICNQCSMLYPSAVPCILSACLVSLEPDSCLRLMPDQFTPDERFSQTSVNSQLSTPQDVSCTHILVFPTSATTQSSQATFQEQHISGDLGDDEFLKALGDDDMADGIVGNDFNDLFDSGWDPIEGQTSPIGSPRRDAAGGVHSPGCGVSLGMDGNSCGMSGGQQKIMEPCEEVGIVLQQPLALGYLVSTAPTGRMPQWFWTACPHLEGVCPAFLKNALHLHSPNIQQNSDDLFQQSTEISRHPLDSQFTTDVLRYVLEGYNALSWLALDSNTKDRLSCLPVHMQVLVQLYHTAVALL